MNVTVSYLGQLRHIAGIETEDRSVPDGASLTDVLKELAAGYDEQFGRILFDEAGVLRGSMMVLINDALVMKDALPNLNNGDRVTLLPAIAGG